MEKIFGNYRIAASVKADSSTSTYYARLSTEDKWHFMVKMLDADIVRDQEVLLAELETIFQLRHPHVLPIIDYGIEEGVPYFVTEYMPHGSLRDLLDRVFPTPIPMQDALKIFMQVGMAVCYAHSFGVLHGHIKPQNVLFNNADDVLLADFHLFKEPGESGKGSYEVQSAYYPQHEVLSEKSDQYALGCLGYELFTGQLPAAYGSAAAFVQQNLDETIVDAAAIGWLEQIEIVLLKAMAEDPDERYASVTDLLQAIDELEMPLYTAESSLKTFTLGALPAIDLYQSDEIAKKDSTWPPLPQVHDWYKRQTSLSGGRLSPLSRVLKWSRRQKLLRRILPLLFRVCVELRRRQKMLGIVLSLGMVGMACLFSLLLFLPAQHTVQIVYRPTSIATTATPQSTVIVLPQRELVAKPTLVALHATNANLSAEATPSSQESSSGDTKAKSFASSFPFGTTSFADVPLRPGQLPQSDHLRPQPGQQHQQFGGNRGFH